MKAFFRFVEPKDIRDNQTESQDRYQYDIELKLKPCKKMIVFKLTIDFLTSATTPEGAQNGDSSWSPIVFDEAPPKLGCWIQASRRTVEAAPTCRRTRTGWREVRRDSQSRKEGNILF